MTKKNRMRLNLSLSKEEMSEIKFNASQLNMKPSVYAKKLTLKHPIAQPKMPSKTTKDIYHQTKKIGTNLNQLAKTANRNKYLIDKPKLILLLVKSIHELTKEVEKLCRRLR